MSDLRERNKEHAREWMAHCWDGLDETEGTIDRLLDPASVGFLEGVVVRGAEDFRRFRDGYLYSFPGMNMQVEELVAEGDWVVVRWRARGTQKKPLMNIPASGREIDVIGSTWLRFSPDGKIVEGHDTWNQGAVMAYLAGAPGAQGYLEGARRRL